MSENRSSKKTTALGIVFYVPNLIDYGRAVMLAFAWANIDQPETFLSLYILQIILDFFDGFFAKRLNQISALGAWLDVALDNIGRGILWTYVCRYGFLISCLEWMTFCCTQRFGAEWKKTFEEAPFLVKQVFKNNFRTPLGLTAITAGLQILPVWIYIQMHYSSQLTGSFLVEAASLGILIYCSVGRLISAGIEIWVVFKSLEGLVLNDVKEKNKIN